MPRRDGKEERLPDARLEIVPKLLGLIGLGVRGRLAVVGIQQVREAAFRGRLAFAVIAPDASRHSLEKVVPLLHARRVPFVNVPSAAQLGAAVGRETAAAVGIVDHQLAKGIRALVDSGSRGAL